MAQNNPGTPRPRTGFGFDDIMAGPDRAGFRRWYDAASLLPPVPGPRKPA